MNSVSEEGNGNGMVCMVQAVGLQGLVAKAAHKYTCTPQVCGHFCGIGGQYVRVHSSIPPQNYKIIPNDATTLPLMKMVTLRVLLFAIN